VKEDSYQILNWRNWEVKEQDRDEWRSENQEGQGPLWAVVPLMMMMMIIIIIIIWFYSPIRDLASLFGVS
jgi:hypothetical protein